MPRRKGNVDAKISTQVRALSKRIEGHKCSLSSNPGTFVERPWNGWTYEISQTTAQDLQSTVITILMVLTQLANKNGIPVERLRIKVQSSGVWGIVSSTLLSPDIECKFYELAGTTLDSPILEQFPRSTQRDKGTLNLPAKCGYVYPMRDSKDIYGHYSGDRKIVDTKAVTTGTDVVTRVHLLWQSSDV